MRSIYKTTAVVLAVLTVMSCKERIAPEADPEIIFSSNNPELVFTSLGGDLAISFTSAAKWTASVDKAWCTVSPSRGEAGECTVVLNAGENFTYSEREVVLTIHSGSLKETLTITQVQNDAIVVAQDEYRVMATGGTLEFAVNVNVDFEVVVPQDCDWIEYVEPGKALEEVPVTFVVAPREDDSYEHRQAEISFVAGDIEQTVTVIQYGRQDPSVLRIAHTAAEFAVPLLDGLNFLYGTVSWGDGQSEEYGEDLVHVYENQDRSYTVVLDAPGAEKFTLGTLTGVTDLDLSEF